MKSSLLYSQLTRAVAAARSSRTRRPRSQPMRVIIAASWLPGDSWGLTNKAPRFPGALIGHASFD
jgi:hypothetical protein